MPADILLWLEERTFAIFFATPFSRCRLLAPLSFFLKAEIPSDGEIVVRTTEKAKEPKLNLAVIGVYGFNPTFVRVYPKLKPSWMNEMEIPDAVSLLISEGFKIILDVMESAKRDVKMSRSSLRVAWDDVCLGM
jgi:dTDP-glucose pyrophosphorylase